MILLMLAALLQATAPSLKTIERGQNSQVESPRQATVRMPAEWATLWRAHAPNRPAPDIDFSTTMVAAVFLGSRPTGGFSVEIVRTRVDGQSLVVEYVEKRPAPDAITAQVLSSPYHIVAVPAHSGTVSFVKLRTEN